VSDAAPPDPSRDPDLGADPGTVAPEAEPTPAPAATQGTPDPASLSPRRRAAAALLRQRERDRELGLVPDVTSRTPRATRAAATRPSLSGPDLRPIPRAPVSTPRREGAPAAPRPGAGVAYPMPGDEDDIPDLPDPAAPPLGVRVGPGQRGTGPFPSAPIGRAPAPVSLSPRMIAIFGALFGLGTIASVIALLIQLVPPRDERSLVVGSASAPGSASAKARAEAAAPAVKKRKRTPIPGPWRVSELSKDSSIAIETGLMARKSLFDALGDKGVPKAEVYRIIKSFDGVRKFDRARRKDRFTVAFERGSKKVKAFEYATSPSEVWQSRTGDNGLLTGQKLDMKIGEEEYSGSFYVGKDVAASYRAAGFEDGILAALDEALAGNMSSDGFEEGGTVKVIAVEETALGLFSRYKRIIAMEYKPPSGEGKSVRIYTFNGTESRGYWNDKGRQPNAGGWRSPIPGAPITSHFNPKRLHPVLHTVMPHTGTDFGAPTGAPIYSAYRGTVENVGPLGPCGNTVVISHPKGITTGYCHMSRFAKIKVGEKVGTHQLVGYVGATGRATGPHLHFFVKKQGKFVDSRTLHLDGDRPVPSADRPAFLAAKAELDRRLDAIPMPDPPPEPEKPAPAAAASASAAPEAPPEKSSKRDKGDKRDKRDKGDKDSKERSSGRHARQIGSPKALAAAQAEPGIHPAQMVEAKPDEFEDDGPGPAPADEGNKADRKPEPDDDEDDK
jgi:murein DD-endopeptidase MepM/ murein hydrolase activator NlpD